MPYLLPGKGSKASPYLFSNRKEKEGGKEGRSWLTLRSDRREKGRRAEAGRHKRIPLPSENENERHFRGCGRGTGLRAFALTRRKGRREGRRRHCRGFSLGEAPIAGANHRPKEREGEKIDKSTPKGGEEGGREGGMPFLSIVSQGRGKRRGLGLSGVKDRSGKKEERGPRIFSMEERGRERKGEKRAGAHSSSRPVEKGGSFV